MQTNVRHDEGLHQQGHGPGAALFIAAGYENNGGARDQMRISDNARCVACSGAKGCYTPGAPPWTKAFSSRATALFIAAVSSDCSASSLSTAPSAHLVRVRVRVRAGVRVRVEVRVRVRVRVGVGVGVRARVRVGVRVRRRPPTSAASGHPPSQRASSARRRPPRRHRRARALDHPHATRSRRLNGQRRGDRRLEGSWREHPRQWLGAQRPGLSPWECRAAQRCLVCALRRRGRQPRALPRGALRACCSA